MGVIRINTVCLSYICTTLAIPLVLCYSAASENKLSAILLLLFAQSNRNSFQWFQGFRQTLRRNFIWIRQQVKHFPIDPHLKKIHLQYRLRVCLKRWNDRGEFKFDWVNGKNNITKNLFSLAPEKHNTYSRLSLSRTRISRILRNSKRLSESKIHFDCRRNMTEKMLKP